MDYYSRYKETGKNHIISTYKINNIHNYTYTLILKIYSKFIHFMFTKYL